MFQGMNKLVDLFYFFVVSFKVSLLVYEEKRRKMYGVICQNKLINILKVFIKKEQFYFRNKIKF